VTGKEKWLSRPAAIRGFIEEARTAPIGEMMTDSAENSEFIAWA
jgi:hypothetical protein